MIRGGGFQSFRPTHPAEDPPTQTPPPLQINSYKRSLLPKRGLTLVITTRYLG